MRRLCWKWEEIVAGAYRQAGWNPVTLTPKRGDKGRDVIAEIAGIGELRHLGLGPLRYVDQVKAKSPTAQVGPDVIRDMRGVLLEELNATKAIITTTSTFSKGAVEAAAKFSPTRLELRDGTKLIRWLEDILAARMAHE